MKNNRRDVRHGFSGYLLFMLVSFLFTQLISCSWENENEKTPNIIFISLDTLRYDAVGSFVNDHQSNTPKIDEFAQDCVLYSEGYAPISHTLMSHMSMMTGLYPDAHGVIGPERVLPGNIQPLAELLSRAGYNTAGLFSVNWLNGGFGFGRGFHFYERIPYSLDLAEQLNKKAFRLLADFQEAQNSFFLFLHYYDVHSDFLQDHPPYNTVDEFQIQGYRKSVQRFCDNEQNCATKYLKTVVDEKRLIPLDDVALLKELYLAGVRYTDDKIGTLFNELKEKNLYDKSLIVLVADHGEEFQEHGQLLHSQTYEETVKVPILVKFPKKEFAGMIVGQFAEVMDILPTILQAAGVAEPSYVQGKSLQPDSKGRIAVKKDFAFMQDKKQRMTYAIRRGSHKAIFNLDSGVVELYLLEDDGHEEKNVANAYPSLVQDYRQIVLGQERENRLLAKSFAQQSAGGKQVKDVLSDEDRKQLKSLGYIK